VSQLAMYLPPALSKPRVRIYAAGHAISVLGGWLQQIALSWLIYRLTGSIFLLGLTGFLLQIPYLLLGPFTGAVVDRVPRLPLLIAIDLILAALAATLAVLAAVHVTDIRIYLTIATLIGIASAFELPARQSLFTAIVDDDRSLLPSAIALSGVIFNAGRMVGPAIAGVMLLYLSEAWCFAINAVSFFGIIAALVAMKLPPQTIHPISPTGHQPTFFESITFLWSLPAVRFLLPMTACVGLFGVSYIHLMPSIAHTFFDGTSSLVGLLMSGAGIGAMSAAGFLSMQRGTSRQARLVTIAPFVLGLAILLFSLSRTLPVSFVLLAVMGCSIMLTSASTNVLIQQSVPDAWRGRAISLYSMSFQGMAPLGNLLAGAMASWIGLPTTLALNGVLILAAACVLHWRLRLEPGALLRPPPVAHDVS
jgi:MFS family permease